MRPTLFPSRAPDLPPAYPKSYLSRHTHFLSRLRFGGFTCSAGSGCAFHHAHMQSRSSRRAGSKICPALGVAVILGRVEDPGLAVRPCAKDEQLVGVGQGGCALPSRKGSVRGARYAGPGGGRGRQRQHKGRARGGRTRDWRVLGAGHTRGGAHIEHEVHAPGAGRVEAQRLVESRRFLPSRKQGVRCRGRDVRAGRRGS